MNENLDLTVVLKDCPKGTKFYSSTFGNVEFLRIDKDDFINPIVIKWVKEEGNSYIEYLSKDGKFRGLGECIIFPSKDQRDWSKWQRPFKDGDVVYANADDISYIIIYYKQEDNTIYRHVCFCLETNTLDYGEHIFTEDPVSELRYASEEEKQRLFDSIRANGYVWNAEAKTLEKLVVSKEEVDDGIVMSDIYFDKENYADEVELHLGNYEIETRDGKTYAIFKNQENKIKPKFKVGNVIISKNGAQIYKVTNVTSEYYSVEIQTQEFTCTGVISIKEQDNWILVPNKFDPKNLKHFDKVLVRQYDDFDPWCVDFYSYYDEDEGYVMCTGNVRYDFCVPYNDDTKHLIGKFDDAPEFYRYWEE